MRPQVLSLVLSTLFLTASAAPARRSLLDNIWDDTSNIIPAIVPDSEPNSTARAEEVAANRAGYLYIPSQIGQASFQLGGPKGEARVQSDIASWMIDRQKMNASLEADLRDVQEAVNANKGLHSLDDYTKVLYEGKWKNSVPGGESLGMLTNYTQDLLFSMERLSLNPYPLRRVKPSDRLPFSLPASESILISGLSTEALQASGSLFIVDHSYQAKYPKTEGKFGAACTALFYIHPISKDFLPLAIKTNTGADLIYTPLDEPNDWLLAKMMFNANDLFHSQTYHLAATHAVGEPVHIAALKTMSKNHPVALILGRLMNQSYAIRPTYNSNLFNPGGIFDQVFHSGSEGARQFVTEFYPKAGSYQGTYLEADLEHRGLINCSYGPPLKFFPFYYDALPLKRRFEIFFRSFVRDYYYSDEGMTYDREIQAWFLEATNGAKVINFPNCGTRKNPCGLATLSQVLTHFAFLTGVAHHTLNTGDPVANNAVLPFHPAALYQPIPTTKGVKDILQFLPPPPNAIQHIATFASFNRPYFQSENRTLIYAFNRDRFSSWTKSAIARYKTQMGNYSTRVRARKFDKDGLCLGMPFVWKGLDPGTIPYSFAV